MIAGPVNTKFDIKDWFSELSALASDAEYFRSDPDATWNVPAVNTYCGDNIVLHVRGDQNNCHRIHYSGEACHLCRASTVVLCREMHDAPWADFEQLQGQLDAALSADVEVAFPAQLEIFSSVRKYPVRQQCVRLPWAALLEARKRGELA